MAQSRSVVAEIQAGRFAEPDGLPRFVAMVARRGVRGDISGRERTRNGEIEIREMAQVGRKANEEAIEQKTRLAERALAVLSPMEREILKRRYLRPGSRADLHGNESEPNRSAELRRTILDFFWALSRKPVCKTFRWLKRRKMCALTRYANAFNSHLLFDT